MATPENSKINSIEVSTCTVREIPQELTLGLADLLNVTVDENVVPRIIFHFPISLDSKESDSESCYYCNAEIPNPCTNFGDFKKCQGGKR